MKTTNTEHIAEIAIILARWLEYIAIDNRYKMHLDVLLKSVIVSQKTTKLVSKILAVNLQKIIANACLILEVLRLEV